MRVNSTEDGSNGLLWPSNAVMTILLSMSRPRNAVVVTEDTVDDLLWPAELINHQARLRKRRGPAQPLAVATFILSLVLGFVVGPMQLILAAMKSDYTWATATYFPLAVYYVLFGVIIVAIMSLVTLVMVWRSEPKVARLVATLVAGSLAEVALIWYFGCIHVIQPHQLTLALLTVVVLFFLVALFVARQYTEREQNGTCIKVLFCALGILAIVEAGLSIGYLVQNPIQADMAELNQLAAEQAAAQVADVPVMLSNLTFTLCSGKYKVVYLSENRQSGLFECEQSGEVYSVADSARQDSTSVRGVATYLGTTKNGAVSAAFPMSVYLYRSMPEALSEDELALMMSASSEQELVDNLAPQIMEFWREHHDHSLHLSAFYNLDMSMVTSTRDFILMSALETMVMVDQLPHGKAIRGYYDGKMLNYIYQADIELTALNELGANPELYALSSLGALRTNRHISIHLSANETLELESLRQRLYESFTGGIDG